MDFFNDPKSIFNSICCHTRSLFSFLLFCAMFVFLLVFSKCSIGIVVLEKCDNKNKHKIRIREERFDPKCRVTADYTE